MAVDDFYDEPSHMTMMFQKFQKNPLVAVGCVGFVATAIIGAYKFKTRPKRMSVGSYLVQLRVIGQSFVVGSLAIGMTYQMLNEYVLKKKKD